MFATLRRHQKWFWAAIIAVVIPSFVIFFTPDVTRGRLGREDFGSIYGHPIGRDEYVDAYRETQLTYFFNYREWPSDTEASRFNFDVPREARNRVLLLDKLRQLGIQASEDATVQWITNTFFDRRQRAFHPEVYRQFVDKVLAEKGFRERDFERYVAHEVGIRQLVATFGVSGTLVTPLEAAALYRREHEQVDTEAVVFSASNYLASISVSSNAVAQFYTNRLANYRIPERVQVKYVKFAATNYFKDADQRLAKETNLNQRIEAYYQQQGPSFFVDTNGTVLAEPAAKQQIKDRMREELGMEEALRKANVFASELFKIAPVKADNLNRLASSNGFPVRVTEPFDAFEGPKDLKVLANFPKVAFALTEEDPFPSPVRGEDAFYVLAYDKKFPEVTEPPLEPIRAKVTQDYVRAQALIMARRQGELFHTRLTNELAAGKKFEAVCSEAKVKPIVLPKFSLSTQDWPKGDVHLELSQVKDLALGMSLGKPGLFTATRDGGFILYLRARLPVDEVELKRDLADFTKGLAQERQGAAFSDWLTREIKLANLRGPATAPAKSRPQ